MTTILVTNDCRLKRRLAAVTSGAATPTAMLVVCIAIANATSPALAEDAVLAEFAISLNQEIVDPILVPVAFGERQYRFELDTGAAVTTFDSRLEGLLRRTGKAIGVVVPGGATVVDAYRAPRGAIGAVGLAPLDQVCCQDIGLGSASPTQKVDGVLGVDALKGCILKFDFDKAQLSFLRSVPADSGVRIDLDRRRNLPTIMGVLGQYGSRSFVIDTGFNLDVMLGRGDFAAVLTRGNLLLAGNVGATTEAGSMNIRLGALSGTLTVGGHTHTALSVGEMPGAGNNASGDAPNALENTNLLGLNYLSRYVVTLDFAHFAVYLKPGASFRALRVPRGLQGIRLVRQGDRIVVLSVREGSKTAVVATPGDVLHTINGASAAGMSESEVVRRISDMTNELELVFAPVSEGRRSWALTFGARPAALETSAKPDDPSRALAPSSRAAPPAGRSRRRWLRK